MLRFRWWAAAILWLMPGAAVAQASPYLALDDPSLPILEHLISRGDVADPSPFVRPFRRADAVRVLEAALKTAAPATAKVIDELLTRYTERTDEARWRVAPRAGFQTASHARRDPLHPAGSDGIWPYAEVGFEGVFGPVALVARPVGETRLLDDPDWLGRKNLDFTGRMADAYISAQWKWVRLLYGKTDQEWGPGQVYGIPISTYGYGREFAGLRVGTRDYYLLSESAQLRDETDSLGQVIHRYFFAHRLGFKISDPLRMAVWETVVLGGPDREFDWRYNNPLSVMLLANTYGLGDDSNIMVGLDLDWKIARAVHLQGQLAIDDFQYKNRSSPTRYPDRYAFTIALFGPLGDRLGYRALYSQASSLAFRTSEPFQNFTDGGVGLGRSFDDNDQLSAFVTVPVRRNWMLTPELTMFRQGQGRINDPVPPPGTTAAGQTPNLFIGTVEHTYRAALGISGQKGILAIQANAGFHHITNEGNQAGHTVDRFEGRLTATIGHAWQGVIRGE